MPEYPSRPGNQPEHSPSQNTGTPVNNFDVENTAESPFVRRQSELLQMALSESRIYVSPLPLPADLEKMDHILPGAFERLLNMAEQDAKATRENETKIVDATIADRKAARHESSRGQIFGLIVAILGFVLSGVIAALGHPVSATFLGFAPLAALVSIFVVGKNRKSASTGNDGAADD